MLLQVSREGAEKGPWGVPWQDSAHPPTPIQFPSFPSVGLSHWWVVWRGLGELDDEVDAKKTLGKTEKNLGMCSETKIRLRFLIDAHVSSPSYLVVLRWGESKPKEPFA